MNERDLELLKAIASEIDMSISLMGSSSIDEFINNEMLSRAVCMTVINIGELVKGLSDDIRKQYPHVPWKEAAAFRDVTAHKYLSLRMEIVYQTVTCDFKQFKSLINDIINK